MKNDFSEFKAGIYHHYKGPLYLTLGLAHDSNDASRTAVIYIALNLDKAKTGPRLAVRTYEDFYAQVDSATGEVVDKDDPKATPRFKFLGQSWEEGMS